MNSIFKNWAMAMIFTVVLALVIAIAMNKSEISWSLKLHHVTTPDFEFQFRSAPKTHKR